jgi:multiple sugar transport system ATP-binding protein
MTGVTFKSVSKRYGDVVALSPLDLSIKSGEFVSLLGPSGSGKTTTLNLLSGLTDADEGRILIGDRDVTHLSPDKREIALVFQSYALYPHLTVFENLAFPLQARRPRVTEAAIEKKVRETAHLLGIGELLPRFPKEISGGQQQRVALGRAIVRDPKVFLLDEPLSNLDARLRIRMRRELKSLHTELGSTIVYVTHDQAEAMTLSSRIAVFNRGILQQFDSPATIYDRPVNTFVANFVGDRETNFLEGQLSEQDGKVVVRGAAYALTLSRQGPKGNSGDVLIGIRPEAVSPGTTTNPNTIDAVVAQTELSGPDLYLIVKLRDGQEMSCRCGSADGFRVGEKIKLSLDEGRIHLFDRASGRCISHGGGVGASSKTMQSHSE